MAQGNNSGENQRNSGPAQNQENLIAKSGKVWSRNAPTTARRGPQDIIRNQQGIMPERRVDNIQAAFKLVITVKFDDIINTF